jgi:hypothetical protein
MGADLNIHEIILQLVKTDKAFDELDLSTLLPIDNVYKGFGLYGGTHKINFESHEEYGNPYEIEVNLNDDDERVEKLTNLNQDIQKYNEWASQKNNIRDEELFEKLPVDGVAKSDKELGVEAKWYPSMQEYKIWQFVVSKSTPKIFRESYIEDLITTINHEELYKLKERLPVEEFVVRFNVTILEYLRIFINEAIELDAYNSGYTWYEPYMAFIRWFHNKGLIFGDYESLFDIQKSNRFETTDIGLSPKSSWDSITITLLPSEHSPIPHINIVSPEYNETKTIDRFGFAKASKIDEPNQLFETLVKFATTGGRITSSSSIRVDETPVSRLRSHLKSLFGIKTPPISNFTKVNGYKCAFHIQDARLNTESYNEIIKKHNQSQFRQQDALMHTADIRIDPVTGETIFQE